MIPAHGLLKCFLKASDSESNTPDSSESPQGSLCSFSLFPCSRPVSLIFGSFPLVIDSGRASDLKLGQITDKWPLEFALTSVDG